MIYCYCEKLPDDGQAINLTCMPSKMFRDIGENNEDIKDTITRCIHSISKRVHVENQGEEVVRKWCTCVKS